MEEERYVLLRIEPNGSFCYLKFKQIYVLHANHMVDWCNNVNVSLQHVQHVDKYSVPRIHLKVVHSKAHIITHDINYPSRTSLHLASSRGHTQTVQLLIDHGADKMLVEKKELNR